MKSKNIDHCNLIIENVKSINPVYLDNIKDAVRIHKKLFNYENIYFIAFQGNGNCNSLLHPFDTFQLKNLEELPDFEFFIRNNKDRKSDLVPLCDHFKIKALLPIHKNNKCIALLGIDSQMPTFTDHEIDTAKFFAGYIDSMLNTEDLVKNLKNYSDRMQKILQEMGTLHEITHALESTESIDSLLEYIMKKSMNVMQAEASSLMLVIEESNELEFKVALGPKGTEVKPFRLPIGKGISGWVAETGQAVLIPDAYSDPRFDSSFDKKTGFRTHSMLCVPMIHKSKTVGVMTVLNRLDRKPFSEDDRRLFTIFASQAALSIENAQLLIAAIEKERLDKELQLASEIQQLLIPQSIPKIPFLDIAADYIPCKEVSGDFYDIMKLDENRYIFVVADVSGKGIPGAMVVSNMQATLRAYLEYSSDLLSVVSKLNEAIIR